MNYSISRKVNYGLLLLAGITLGLITLSIANATGAKNMLMHKLGLAPKGAIAINDVSCAVPKDSGDDVYFVSCAGFF
jgi:hypothetical protein